MSGGKLFVLSVSSVSSFVKWRHPEKSNSKLANAPEALRAVPGPPCGYCLHHLCHNLQWFISSGSQVCTEQAPSARYFLVLW